MRVKVRVKIDSNDYKNEFETNGILREKENILVYSDMDNNVNTVDFNNQIVTRKSNEVEIELLLLKESYCNIFLKDYNKTVKESIVVHKLINNMNFFEVKYTIYGDNTISYKVEIIKL